MDPTLKVARSVPEGEIRARHRLQDRRPTCAPTTRASTRARTSPAIIAGADVEDRHARRSSASFPIPEVMRNINSFTHGRAAREPEDQDQGGLGEQAGSTRPRRREAAETLIDQGADVLMQNTDSSGGAADRAGQGRQVRLRLGLGHDRVRAEGAPRLGDRLGPYYTRVAEAWLAGKPFKENIWWGMKEGMNDFININKIVPEAAQKQVAAKKAEIVAGKFHPFTGPDQGQRRLDQGAGGQDAQRQGDRLDQLVRQGRRRQSAGQVK